VNLFRGKMAKRMAYTGNAAIFPRNKFTASDGGRLNRLVDPSGVDGSARGGAGTILTTEFLYLPNWQSLAVEEGKIKSHRPITPFVGGSAGSDVYNEPDIGGAPRFFYPPLTSIYKLDQLGAGMIEDGNSILNAVGRTHPGGDKGYGGTANFSFVDGHVARMTVIDSVNKRLWGERFFSLTGGNAVNMN
jgi:prepilin-type processing-associated H-X9-DG protein